MLTFKIVTIKIHCDCIRNPAISTSGNSRLSAYKYLNLCTANYRKVIKRHKKEFPDENAKRNKKIANSRSGLPTLVGVKNSRQILKFLLLLLIGAYVYATYAHIASLGYWAKNVCLYCRK